MSDVTKLKADILGDMEMLTQDVKKLIRLDNTKKVNDSNGTVCPECGSIYNRVVDTRPKGTTQYRRRECENCGRRWKTIEVRV